MSTVDDPKCPECGEPTVCESVDIGVGILYGPAYCECCWWSSNPQAGKVIDGWYHDAAGGATRVGALVKRACHLGGDALAEHVADVFADDDAEPECPGEHCPRCNGEVCGLCGAGSWRTPSQDGRPCAHGVDDRHMEADFRYLSDETLPLDHAP